MWNVFEQPWTLLGAAILAFLAVMTFRALCPSKERRWQMAIPVAVAGLAVALDLLVATDPEKIHGLVRAAIKAGQEEDVSALEGLLAQDYRDSFHRDRQHLVEHARTALARSPIASIRVLGRAIERLEPPDASVALSLLTHFDPNSLVAQTYRPVVFVGVRFSLARQANGRWLITAIELTEVDKNPVSWGQISGNL